MRSPKYLFYLQSYEEASEKKLNYLKEHVYFS